jgi:hypothetical protein
MSSWREGTLHNQNDLTGSITLSTNPKRLARVTIRYAQEAVHGCSPLAVAGAAIVGHSWHARNTILASFVSHWL